MMARIDASSLLSEAETARCASVSTAALRKWRREGKGPAFLKLGKLVRYRTADIEQWLAGCVVSSRKRGGDNAE